MDKAAEAVLTLNGRKGNEAAIKKTTREEQLAYAEVAFQLVDFFDIGIKEHDGSLEKHKKAQGLMRKAHELLEKEVTKAKDRGEEVPDGMSPKVKELHDRSLRLETEARYQRNGDYSNHTEQMAEMLTFLHDFNYCGNKLFRIEEQITHELTLTHIEGVGAEFFKLPYQTICVHSPYNEVVRIKGKAIKWSYLSEYKEEDGRHIYTMYVNEDGYPFFHEFIFQDDQPLGKQVKTQIGELYGKEAAKENMAVFSMVASMILYINSSERDVREVHPRVSDERKDSRLPLCSIGGSIKVDRSFYMAVGADGAHSTNTIHILKWTVRGHFRNQACGPNLSERKIIWVRPYLKGKERANEAMPARNAEYSVEVKSSVQ